MENSIFLEHVNRRWFTSNINNSLIIQTLSNIDKLNPKKWSDPPNTVSQHPPSAPRVQSWTPTKSIRMHGRFSSLSPTNVHHRYKHTHIHRRRAYKNNVVKTIEPVKSFRFQPFSRVDLKDTTRTQEHENIRIRTCTWIKTCVTWMIEGHPAHWWRHMIANTYIPAKTLTDAELTALLEVCEHMCLIITRPYSHDKLNVDILIKIHTPLLISTTISDNYCYY